MGKSAEFFIDEVSITHSDPRRELVEFYNGEEFSIQNVRWIRVKRPKPGEDITLGGHYHDDRELLFIVEGTLEQLRVQNTIGGEFFERRQLKSGSRIHLPANYAHELVFARAATLIALSENPYNPGKLIPYSISPHQ